MTPLPEIVERAEEAIDDVSGTTWGDSVLPTRTAKIILRTALKDYIESLQKMSQSGLDREHSLFEIQKRLSADLALLEGDKKE